MTLPNPVDAGPRRDLPWLLSRLRFWLRPYRALVAVVAILLLVDAAEAERLADMPVFEAIDRELLDVVAKAFVTEQFAAERVVIREGDDGDRFYVIARGRLEVCREGADKHPQRVAVLSDGDHFGEMALLTDAPRNATVRTLTPATLLALPRGQFLNLVGRSPGVRARVEATFARRQQELATLDAELWRAKKEPVRDVADLTVHPSVDALEGGVPT